MSNDIRLGRVFGIEIFISYSWFLIFALVTVSLAYGVFPSRFPGQSSATYITIGLVASALFFASLLFHELSHSLVANRNHIPIKKITLFIFGGMSQMSAEPADPKAEFKMAAAGPLASFFLAAFFFLLASALAASGLPIQFFAPFSWLAEINLLLGIFNLAPGFPLDGGRLLRAVVWRQTGDFDRATRVAARSGQGVALVLIGLGLFLFLFGQIGGIWLVLIGWFLYQSALSGFRQIVIEHALAGIPVKDVMSPDVTTVPPDTTLEDLVNHYFLKHRFGRFPVVSGNDLLGVVTLHDVKDVPHERWPVVRAGEIVEPVEKTMVIKSASTALKALFKMADDEIGHLLVVDEDEKLVGIITRSDLFRVIRVRGELEI